MAKHFVLSANGFKGLDERAGCSPSVSSLPKLVNMRVTESGHLEKRCGYSSLCKIAEGVPITALWKGQTDEGEAILAACGKAVYKSTDGGESFAKLLDTEDTVMKFFSFGGKVYCLGGGLYRCTGEDVGEVEGYVPTVATGCSSDGAGTVLESPNMLTQKRRVLYNGDGKSTVFSLPEKGLAAVNSVKVNGELLIGKYTSDKTNGTVTFYTAPTDGINNVEICYTASGGEESKKIITGCRYAVVFESRLFVYGCAEYPDRVYRSELADGIPSCEYFSELGYHSFEKSVTSLIPCYNRLLIFFDDSACFTYADLKTDSTGVSRTSFPVYELHSSKGNTVPGVGCSIENTPVTLCRDGLNRWVSTAIADERSAENISQRAVGFISKLGSSSTGIFLFARKAKSELWLCTSYGTLVYSYALDCFTTYSIKSLCSIYESGDDLILGMSDGRVCLFSDRFTNDDVYPITAEFETPYCTFGAPYSVKSLNGISVSFEGKDEIYCDLTVSSGNKLAGRVSITNLSAPQTEVEGFRKIFARMNFKRFFSAKLHFSTECSRISVADLHLFGKQLDGGKRLN